MTHSIQRLSDLHLSAILFHCAANDTVGTENSTDTFASAGSQQSGKSVDLTLFDIEIKRLDPGVTAQILGLE